MSIQYILGDKGADIISIDASCGLEEAAKVMRKHRIGALMVSDGDEVGIGMFSERDILQAIAAEGRKALDGSVRDYMTRVALTVTLETSVEEAMEIMTEHRVRHLPVQGASGYCGMVSIGDLVNYRIHQSERETAALRDYIKTG